MGTAGRPGAVLLGCLLSVCLLVAACSSPSHAGASYEQIVKPANAAWATFVTRARTWPGGEVPASGAVLAQDVVKSWKEANRRLLANPWPGSDRSEIAALVRADTKVYRELEELPTTGAAVDEWWARLISSFSTEQAAAARVRLALHLPALTGS